MTTNPTAPETCGTCGAVVETGRVFCRFYELKACVAFCSPGCAREHLFAAHVNGGHRLANDLVGQLLTEWQWRELGR